MKQGAFWITYFQNNKKHIEYVIKPNELINYINNPLIDYIESVEIWADNGWLTFM